MSDLVTIDTSNYAAMAKAMGIAGENSSSDKKSNTLPRLKINHSPIMGEAEVQGKSMNVEVVQGGTYKLDIPDDKAVYATSATIRPFIQRFMYKRFIKNMNAKAGEPMGTYHKTLMADNLNIDLKDNQGGFNCGKPSGYIQDFKSLPEKTQELIKQIKRVRVVFGLVDLISPVDQKGNAVEIDSQPFIWEIDNRDAFKIMAMPFTKLSQMKRLPVQHNVTLGTEERKLPNGNCFYLPTASLDMSKTIDLSSADQETFANFLAWVENYNSYIISEWDSKANHHDEEDNSVVGDFIDIEEEVA